MPEPLRVQVDFEATEDPIAGSLWSDGAERRFTGWIGLIAGLRDAAGARSDEDGARTGRVDDEAAERRP